MGHGCKPEITTYYTVTYTPTYIFIKMVMEKIVIFDIYNTINIVIILRNHYHDNDNRRTL